MGTGKSPWPALLRTCGFVVTASDNMRDYWPHGLVNRHWHVQDDDIVDTHLPRAHFDAITCISVLEHVADPLCAISKMQALLNPGGTVLLTTPYGAVGHPNVYDEPDSYGHRNRYPCRQSCPADLASWEKTGLTLLHAEYWQANRSRYWSCGDLVRPMTRSDVPAQLGCFVLQRPA